MADVRFAEPLSVEAITQLAESFDYNESVPLRYWLRSADATLKQAAIYEREGNDQQAYLLLFRHAVLVLDKLAKHPEAHDPRNREASREAKRLVQQNLQKLEIMRPRINRRHERYVEYKKRREAERRLLATQNLSAPDHAQIAREAEPLSLHSRGPSDPAIDGSKQALDAGANKELAVEIAHKEIRRRDAAKKTVRFSDTEQHEGQDSRGLNGTWADLEQQALAGDGIREKVDDLSQKIAEVGRHAHSSFDRKRLSSSENGSARSEAYRYPTVPQKTSLTAGPPKPVKSPLDGPELQCDGVPPRLPPKLPNKESLALEVSGPPPIPGKFPDQNTSETHSRSDSATPQPDLSSEAYVFKPTAYLENGAPLRTMFISPSLRTRFLDIVSPNTRSNLETCGILCGTLSSNALFISRLVIPEQKSTSDTCETVNESALFDYCDSEDLMVLGWIHTHPSQTCFMSSRDLHTHCGYQVMMPESIAIVCAPSKNPSWGVFRLTDPPGLKSILDCSQTGLFHPHGESNIYTDALKPGHVFEAAGLPFEVVDLRPGH